MPSKHKSPLLGWHPPAELSAWVRAEAERRAVPISVILTEAVEAYRKMPRPLIVGRHPRKDERTVALHD